MIEPCKCTSLWLFFSVSFILHLSVNSHMYCTVFFSSLFWNIITFIDVGNPIIIELVLISNIVGVYLLYTYYIKFLSPFWTPFSSMSMRFLSILTFFNNGCKLQTSIIDDMQLIYTWKQCLFASLVQLSSRERFGLIGTNLRNGNIPRFNVYNNLNWCMLAN